MVAVIAGVLTSEVLSILKAAHAHKGSILFDPNTGISSARMLQTAQYAVRDLQRLELDQSEHVQLTKHVAYIIFWFAKIRPIIRVDRIGEDKALVEIVDVNERVAVILLCRLMIRLGGEVTEFMPTPWKACPIKQCSLERNGYLGRCFIEKLTRYFDADSERYRDYLSYTLRYRAISPYLLVAILDQAIFYSCEHVCAPISASG